MKRVERCYDLQKLEQDEIKRCKAYNKNKIQTTIAKIRGLRRKNKKEANYDN